VLDEAGDHKLKQIVVQPGKFLSGRAR